MEFLSSQILNFLTACVLPLFRIGAIFMAAPVLGARYVSLRIRLVLVVLITVFIVFNLNIKVPEFNVFSFNGFLLIFYQVFLGVSIGFFLQMVFQIFVLGAQITAMQMGLGFASMVDPQNGMTVPLLSQYYLITVNTLFFALNGHLQLMQMILESFQFFPISSFSYKNVYWPDIFEYGKTIFSSALMLSLPVVTILLCTNIAFGVMSRTAPQLNIFALGFPVALLVGLFCVALFFPVILQNFQYYLSECFLKIHSWLKN